MGCAGVRGGGRGGDAPSADPPGARGAPKGSPLGGEQRAEADALGGAVLHLPPYGHLLEVRDPSQLRLGGQHMHPIGAPPPSEVHNEEPAQRPPHRLRAPLLLAPLLRRLSPLPHPTPLRQDQGLRIPPRLIVHYRIALPLSLSRIRCRHEEFNWEMTQRSLILLGKKLHHAKVNVFVDVVVARSFWRALSSPA